MIDPAPDAVGLAGNNKSYLLSVNAEVMSPIIRSGIPPPVPTLPIVDTAARSNNIDTDCRSRWYSPLPVNTRTFKRTFAKIARSSTITENREGSYWGLLLIESAY